MPYAFEFPWMGRAIVPLVRGEGLAGSGRSVINELIAFAFGKTFRCCGRFARFRSWLFPGFAAVTRALDDLPNPAAALRNVKPVLINRRTFRMINFPAGEMRTADFPILALAIGRKNECAFLCANQ